jgi:hypothetical protein
MSSSETMEEFSVNLHKQICDIFEDMSLIEIICKYFPEYKTILIIEKYKDIKISYDRLNDDANIILSS